jgi:uncharacterized cupredoxin-like copper-binding protein
MPSPINKVKDEMLYVADNKIDINDIISLVQMSPSLFLRNSATAEDKKAIADIFMHSEDLGNHRVKLAADIPMPRLTTLKSKGYIVADGSVIEFTESGRKILKETILGDEKSALTKQASKKMISKNSYDFVENVLVKIGDPEKFGVKFISISKSAFNKKAISPIEIEKYEINTRKEDGSLKTLKDYSEKELIHVLHLAKKIIQNSSRIALASSKSVPVHRLEAFCEIILKELNS